MSVLPPSVCILLELCAFGSLNDVVKGRCIDAAVDADEPAGSSGGMRLCNADRSVRADGILNLFLDSFFLYNPKLTVDFNALKKLQVISGSGMCQGGGGSALIRYFPLPQGCEII